MRLGILAALVVCLVLTSGAFAETVNARMMGMSAVLAVADDAAAWASNPAALARLNVLPAREGHEWANTLQASYWDGHSGDTLGASWSGFNQEANLGFGAGTWDVRSRLKIFGAGIGKPLGDKWAAGVNFEYVNSPFVGGVSIKGGLLYDFTPAVRGAVTIEDIFGRYDNAPLFNAGLAARVSDRLLLAVDVWDVTDKTDTSICGGAEYNLTPQFCLRAGTFDTGDGHELTFGAGYATRAWSFDAGYENTDDDQWAVTVSHRF